MANMLSALGSQQLGMGNQINALTQAMTTLSQSMAQMTTQRPAINVSTEALEKPERYKGVIGPEARRFVTYFSVWAQSTQGRMNTQQANGTYLRDDRAWIRVALTFMSGPAAIWAQPHLDSCLKANLTPPLATFPFSQNWETFVDVFLKRWDSPSEKQEAIEALYVLNMEKDTAADYTAKFKEIAARTGFSDDDLKYRYHMGLTHKLKDVLAASDKKQGTIDELMATACEIDQRMRQNKIEQAIKEGRPLPRGHNSIVDAYFGKKERASAAPDPDAMDIDVMNIAAAILTPEQRKKWNETMKGRCFACTSNKHQSKDCAVRKEKKKCEHCTLAGHNKYACLRRFGGHPPGPPPRRAAVVRTEEVTSDAEPEFLDPMEADQGPAEIVDPTEMVSVAATSDGKKKRTRSKKKPATSNPEVKASDAASVASTSSLPPAPTVASLFGAGPSTTPSLSWASTVEAREVRKKEKAEEKARLQREIAALRAQMSGSDSDTEFVYTPRTDF